MDFLLAPRPGHEEQEESEEEEATSSSGAVVTQDEVHDFLSSFSSMLDETGNLPRYAQFQTLLVFFYRVFFSIALLIS